MTVELVDCPECEGLGFVGCRSIAIEDPADDPGMSVCLHCIGDGVVEQEGEDDE